MNFEMNNFGSGSNTKKKKRSIEDEKINSHNPDYNKWMEKHSPKKQQQIPKFPSPSPVESKKPTGTEQVHTKASQVIDNEIYYYATLENSKTGNKSDLFVKQSTSLESYSKKKRKKEKGVDEILNQSRNEQESSYILPEVCTDVQSEKEDNNRLKRNMNNNFTSPTKEHSDSDARSKKSKKRQSVDNLTAGGNEDNNTIYKDTSSEISSDSNKKHKRKKHASENVSLDENNSEARKGMDKKHIDREPTSIETSDSDVKSQKRKKKRKELFEKDSSELLNDDNNSSENKDTSREIDSDSNKKHKKKKHTLDYCLDKEDHSDMKLDNDTGVLPKKSKKQKKSKIDDILPENIEKETERVEESIKNDDTELVVMKRKKKKAKLNKELLSMAAVDSEDFFSSTRKACSDSDNKKKNTKNETSKELPALLSEENHFDLILSPIIGKYKKHKKKRRYKYVEEALEEQIYKTHLSSSSAEEDSRIKKKIHILDDTCLSSDYSILGDKQDPGLNLQEDNVEIKEEYNDNRLHEEIIFKTESSLENAKTESIGSIDTFTMEVYEDNETKMKDKKKQPFVRGKYHIQAVKETLQNLDSENVNPIEDCTTFNEILEDAKTEFSFKVLKQLAQLNVILPWAVPALHLIETGIVALPTPAQRAEMEKLDVSIKKGIFSRAEDDLIKGNWKLFCKMNDLPDDPKPFLHFQPDRAAKCIVPVETRLQFGRFLAHGLENRTLVSVYKRFQRLFTQAKLKSGRFTLEEDQIIREFMKTTSSRNPYADLGIILKRSTLSVERRCRKLVQQNTEENNITWTESRISELIKNLLAIADSENIEDLKNRKFSQKDWAQISDSMNLSVVKVRSSWLNTIHPKLFVKKFQNTEIRQRLVSVLIERGEDDWRNVDWDDVATKFDGFTGAALNKLLKGSAYYYLPAKDHHDLKVCLRFLAKVDFKKYAIKGIEPEDLKY